MRAAHVSVSVDGLREATRILEGAGHSDGVVVFSGSALSRVREAMAHAEGGGQALHLCRRSEGPACATLYDRDVERLRRVADGLSMGDPWSVAREGEVGQHVTLSERAAGRVLVASLWTRGRVR